MGRASIQARRLVAAVAAVGHAAGHPVVLEQAQRAGQPGDGGRRERVAGLGLVERGGARPRPGRAPTRRRCCVAAFRPKSDALILTSALSSTIASSARCTSRSAQLVGRGGSTRGSRTRADWSASRAAASDLPGGRQVGGGRGVFARHRQASGHVERAQEEAAGRHGPLLRGRLGLDQLGDLEELVPADRRSPATTRYMSNEAAFASASKSRKTSVAGPVQVEDPVAGRLATGAGDPVLVAGMGVEQPAGGRLHVLAEGRDDLPAGSAGCSP